MNGNKEQIKLKKECQEILLKTARNAISQRLDSSIKPFNPGTIPNELTEIRATFVTLTIQGRLRGCIGMLKAVRPLIEDVAANACSAAFRDPRFSPVTKEELDKLEIHISVLSPPEEIFFSSEQELLTKIRPGIDGLILQDGPAQGTFLPSVWEQLPQKEQFLAHLKLKAGLPHNYWSDTIRVFRYTAEYFPA